MLLAPIPVIRRCREGAKLGPLFADDPRVAETLFRTPTVDGGDVTLDTPDAGPPAVALAKRYGLKPVFDTARMYRNADRGIPAEWIFGVTTFELG